jgi:Na+-driven multidrug efflux pump
MSAPPTAARIARFTAPLVGGTVLALGTQFAVVALLGRLGGPALYVRSVYAPIAFLLLALTSGLSVSLQVAGARCTGRGHPEETAGRLGTVARIGLAAYLGIGALIVVLSGPLASLMTVVPGDRSVFVRFLLSMVLVLPIGFLGELCGAVLRGTGRTGQGSLLTLVSFVLTVGGVALLGNLTGLGLTAVPVATAVSGLVELSLGLLVLRRAGLLDRRRILRGHPEARALVRSVGIPVGASYVLLFVLNLLLLRIVAPYGASSVAGFTLGYTLQSTVIVPAIGCGSAIAVLTNQYDAAGETEYARRALRTGTALVAGCYLAVTLVLLLAGRGVVAPLSTDPATVAEAGRFMVLVGPTFGCTGLILTLLTALEQTGRGAFSVALNLVYFAALVGIGGWVAHAERSSEGLYQVMAVSAVVGLLTGGPLSWWLLRRRAGAVPHGADETEAVLERAP